MCISVSLPMPLSKELIGTRKCQKKAFSSHCWQILKRRSATCESRCWSPPLSFLLKLCVIVFHTHRYRPPKFQPNPKHHDRGLIFPHFARAAGCLLLPADANIKPIFKAFWEFWRVKTGHHGLKTG